VRLGAHDIINPSIHSPAAMGAHFSRRDFSRARTKLGTSVRRINNARTARTHARTHARTRDDDDDTKKVENQRSEPKQRLVMHVRSVARAHVALRCHAMYYG